jgi:hypothetical protein
MDGERFDRLARGLAAGMGRRRLARAVLGGVAAVLLGGGSRALAQDGGDAADDGRRDCPDGCPDGQRCIDGACREDDGACREDRDCRDEADACIGGRCEDGRCVQFVVDCVPGYLCCGNGECCPQPCATDIDCFVADPCQVGRCLDGACSFEREDGCFLCEDDDDCAILENPAFCCEGVCTSPCPEGTTLGKGCECVAGSLDDLNADGIDVSVDESGDGTTPSEGDPAADADPPAEGEVESADDGSITLGGPITISTSDAPESTITTAAPPADAAEPEAEPAS